MTGPASQSEKAELKALWQACFHEEQPFLDWFFDERFLPAYCVRKVVGGEIVSAMHGLPVHAHIRDTTLPVALVGGVATREDARGQGHMRDVFTQFLRVMRGYGAAAVLYHPVHAAVYAGLQHYPCADAQFVSAPACGQTRQMPGGARLLDMREAAALYRCYTAFAGLYSCAIARTFDEHAGKLADYTAGGGRCLATYDDNGAIASYCVYFMEDGALYGDECVAPSNAAYAALYRAMAALAGDRPMKLRLPPDVRIYDEAASSATLPHSLIGTVDVQALLAASGCRARTPIEVTDSVIAENNGIFLPDGSRTDAPPHIRMDAGRLAQWAVGYRSMRELVAAGDATLLSEGANVAPDSVGKRVCYLVEEY